MLNVDFGFPRLRGLPDIQKTPDLRGVLARFLSRGKPSSELGRESNVDRSLLEMLQPGGRELGVGVLGQVVTCERVNGVERLLQLAVFSER